MGKAKADATITVEEIKDFAEKHKSDEIRPRLNNLHDEFISHSTAQRQYTVIQFWSEFTRGYGFSNDRSVFIQSRKNGLLNYNVVSELETYMSFSEYMEDIDSIVAEQFKENSRFVEDFSEESEDGIFLIQKEDFSFEYLYRFNSLELRGTIKSTDFLRGTDLPDTKEKAVLELKEKNFETDDMPIRVRKFLAPMVNEIKKNKIIDFAAEETGLDKENVEAILGAYSQTPCYVSLDSHRLISQFFNASANPAIDAQLRKMGPYSTEHTAKKIIYEKDGRPYLDVVYRPWDKIDVEVRITYEWDAKNKVLNLASPMQLTGKDALFFKGILLNDPALANEHRPSFNSLFLPSIEKAALFPDEVYSDHCLVRTQTEIGEVYSWNIMCSNGPSGFEPASRYDKKDETYIKNEGNRKRRILETLEKALSEEKPIIINLQEAVDLSEEISKIASKYNYGYAYGDEGRGNGLVTLYNKEQLTHVKTPEKQAIHSFEIEFIQQGTNKKIINKNVHMTHRDAPTPERIQGLMAGNEDAIQIVAGDFNLRIPPKKTGVIATGATPILGSFNKGNQGIDFTDAIFYKSGSKSSIEQLELEIVDPKSLKEVILEPTSINDLPEDIKKELLRRRAVTSLNEEILHLNKQIPKELYDRGVRYCETSDALNKRNKGLIIPGPLQAYLQQNQGFVVTAIGPFGDQVPELFEMGEHSPVLSDLIKELQENTVNGTPKYQLDAIFRPKFKELSFEIEKIDSSQVTFKYDATSQFYLDIIDPETCTINKEARTITTNIERIGELYKSLKEKAETKILDSTYLRFEAHYNNQLDALTQFDMFVAINGANIKETGLGFSKNFEYIRKHAPGLFQGLNYRVVDKNSPTATLQNCKIIVDTDDLPRFIDRLQHLAPLNSLLELKDKLMNQEYHLSSFGGETVMTKDNVEKRVPKNVKQILNYIDSVINQPYNEHSYNHHKAAVSRVIKMSMDALLETNTLRLRAKETTEIYKNIIKDLDVNVDESLKHIKKYIEKQWPDSTHRPALVTEWLKMKHLSPEDSLRHILLEATRASESSAAFFGVMAPDAFKFFAGIKSLLVFPFSTLPKLDITTDMKRGLSALKSSQDTVRYVFEDSIFFDFMKRNSPKLLSSTPYQYVETEHYFEFKKNEESIKPILGPLLMLNQIKQDSTNPELKQFINNELSKTYSTENFAAGINRTLAESIRMNFQTKGVSLPDGVNYHSSLASIEKFIEESTKNNKWESWNWKDPLPKTVSQIKLELDKIDKDNPRVTDKAALETIMSLAFTASKSNDDLFSTRSTYTAGFYSGITHLIKFDFALPISNYQEALKAENEDAASLGGARI